VHTNHPNSLSQAYFDSKNCSLQAFKCYALIANKTKRPGFTIFIFNGVLLLIRRHGATKRPTATPSTRPIPYHNFIIINNDNGTTSILLPLL
jgi:hypothetical protein